jgi:Ca-activated chloride channel family protein
MKALYTLGVTLSLLLSETAIAQDTNRLAHELYKEGRYAEAAELFNDPAWKGAALYRSDQWWRAAEAFIRANDADSYFNLGNSYVQLSYYALALEAYQQTLTLEPDHADAEYNKTLMLKLLAQDNNDEQSSGVLKPELEELDRVDSDEQSNTGNSESGDDKTDSTETAEGDPDTSEQADREAPSGESGNSGSAGEGESNNDGEQGIANVSGDNKTEETSQLPSGGSENESETNNQHAAGLRNQIESEQATAQWLNNIKHDPYRFLEKRIALELKRRIDAGQSAPDGGSVW